MIAVLLAGASTLMIIPLINQLWLIIVLLAAMRAAGMAGSALNFALVTDLVRSRSDIGKVTSTTVIGGNSFGLVAPIVTGYVVQITGSFDNAFFIAGFLPLIGAVATLTMTRGRRSCMPRQWYSRAASTCQIPVRGERIARLMMSVAPSARDQTEVARPFDILEHAGMRHQQDLVKADGLLETASVTVSAVCLRPAGRHQ